jgi:excisionase family DNA binding protein
MITATDLAEPEHLNCSIDKVYRMARAGQIPFVKVGTEYRFDWDDVKAALTPVKSDPWANPRARRRAA